MLQRINTVSMLGRVNKKHQNFIPQSVYFLLAFWGVFYSFLNRYLSVQISDIFFVSSVDNQSH